MVPVEEETERIIYEVASSHLTEYLFSNPIRGRNIDVEQKVLFGVAVENIIKEAQQSNADIIVMGTKGAKGLQEVFLGSVTAAVAENSTCPVLAVPEGVKFREYKKIVFATDYHDVDVKSIQYLVTLAELFGAKISIVHISDFLTTDDFERELFRLFKVKVKAEVHYENISFELITGHDVDKTLSSYIKHNNVDLIAMSTRKKRNFISRLFDPSLTKKMVHHTAVPLLSLHC
jgi:nucleotide-binding universal stress UspA family protein